MNAPVTIKRLGADASTFVAKEKKLYIDGQWVAAANGKTIDVIDPATGMVFNKVPDGRPQGLR